MIDSISEEALPALFKIVSDAELALTQLTGINLTIKVQFPSAMPQDVELLIRRLVCQEFDLTWAQVASHSRKRPLPYARQSYCHLMRIYTTRTIKYIGHSLGGRDHTTVVHSCQAVSDMLFAQDTDFPKRLFDMIRKLDNEISVLKELNAA